MKIPSGSNINKIIQLRLLVILVFFLPFQIFGQLIPVFLNFENPPEAKVNVSNYDTTSIKARNGSYSLFLDKSNEFGPTISYYNLPKTWIKASVWKHGEGGAIVCSIKENNYYQSEYVAAEQNGEWQKIEAYFLIPKILKEELKIYLYNNKHSQVYFDDFKIEFIDKYSYPNLDKLKSINITVGDSDLLKIEKHQKEAIKIGLIQPVAKKWMNVTLGIDEFNYVAKARIKGDWIDHIENDKWSLRIKIKDSLGIFNQSKTFSVQQPKTRGFLKEWLLHKVLEDEDILTTQYDFVWLKINGESRGVFAFEQHFDKYLLKRQNRIEAPILKFSEDGFWEIVKGEMKRKWKNVPVQNYYSLQVANVECFKKKKTFADTILYNQFMKGSELLDSFRSLNSSVLNSFDMDRFAKWLAIIDVFESYHSLNWINLRFYYNPNSQLIEPVVYDGYEDHPSKPFNSTPIIGYIDSGHDTIYNLTQGIITQFFQQDSFREKYYGYLKRYSTTKYLDEIFEKYDDQIDFFSEELKKEIRYYNFDKGLYYKKAETVNTLLKFGKDKHLLTADNNFTFYSMWKWRQNHPEKSSRLVDTTLFTTMALKATYDNEMLKIYNQHAQDIEVVALVNKNDAVVYLKPTIHIDAFNPVSQIPLVLVNQKEVNQIIYKANGNEYTTDVTKYARVAEDRPIYGKSITYKTFSIGKEGELILMRSKKQ